jgi:hypothetical protein
MDDWLKGLNLIKPKPDKLRPYLLGSDTFVGVGFIPARKGLNVE